MPNRSPPAPSLAACPADPNCDSGAAYLFTTTGQQIAKLLANDAAGAAHFGHSVAISGPVGKEVAIVGAPRGVSPVPGAAYLFDAATGRQMAKLLANDGAPGDNFGFSVAISGVTAIVGASAFEPDEYAIRYPDCDINNADINGDGTVDAFDIEPFLDLLFP